MFCVKEDGKIELLYIQGHIYAANLTITEKSGGFVILLQPGQNKYVTCFAQFTSSAIAGVDLQGLGLKHVFLIVPKLSDFVNLTGNAMEVAICEQCTRLDEVVVDAEHAKSVYLAKRTQIRQM